MTTHQDIDASNLDQILESLKQEKANYVPKSKTTEQQAIKAEPIWGHPMDWLTFVMLVVIVLDHLRKQISWFRCGGSNKKARDSGILGESHDENTKKSTLRNRKRGKKGRKENKKKGLEIDDDEKALKEAKRTAPTGLNFYDLAKIYAVVTMMIDHYGYFGLPGISYTAPDGRELLDAHPRQCSSSLWATATPSDFAGALGATLFSYSCATDGSISV